MYWWAWLKSTPLLYDKKWPIMTLTDDKDIKLSIIRVFDWFQQNDKMTRMTKTLFLKSSFLFNRFRRYDGPMQKNCIHIIWVG